MVENKHPGKITFVEIINGVEKTIKIEDVKNVPESMRFRKGKSGENIPVVKTVAMKMPDGRVKEIIEYGPNGEFLQSTIAAPHPTSQVKAGGEPKPVKS